MSEQIMHQTTMEELIDTSLKYANSGYRLVQIHCTKTPTEMFLIYTYENQDLHCENVKVNVQVGDSVPSLSKIFHPAFLYENEIHDLYGVKFTGMLVDFKGTFYETAVKQPFSTTASLDKE